jgi:dTDP-4-dehydrorhamnose reductase
VTDQQGSPTSANEIANATYKIVKTILNKTDFKDFGTYLVAI